VSYPGSKGQAGTFQRIIGQMPPHKVYVEAFFGSGKVFWEKARAEKSYVIDQRADLLVKAGAEAGVSAICGDAVQLLRLMGDMGLNNPGTLIYCDPPYVLSTRKGREYYEHEMSDDHHLNLLLAVKYFQCPVMISGYPSLLYARELKDWRYIQYQARTRGRTVTECLWCNFPEPEQLHDWRYAGANFRQRLSLNRLAARWTARLDAMPPRKRGFLLNAIAQRHTRQ
jgi:site-specific DNA-adenine methylase